MGPMFTFKQVRNDVHNRVRKMQSTRKHKRLAAFRGTSAKKPAIKKKKIIEPIMNPVSTHLFLSISV